MLAHSRTPGVVLSSSHFRHFKCWFLSVRRDEERFRFQGYRRFVVMGSSLESVQVGWSSCLRDSGVSGMAGMGGNAASI
jgi:hypothetical protein